MKKFICTMLILCTVLYLATTALADTVGFNGPSHTVSGSTATKEQGATQKAIVPVSSMQNLSEVYFWVNRAGTSTQVSFEYVFTVKSNRALYRTGMDNPIRAGEKVTARWKTLKTAPANGITLLVHYTWTP